MKGRANKASGHHKSVSHLAGFDPSVKDLALNLSAFGCYDDSGIPLPSCQVHGYGRGG